MSAGEPLTESVRVRLSANEKRQLEATALKQERSASSIARRAIRFYLEQTPKAARREQ